MSVSFDWDFTEDPKPRRGRDDGDRPPGRGRRWLRRGAVVFILLGLVVLLARVWVVNRLKAVEKREAELRSIVALELKSITQGDAELFSTFQDSVDRNWQERQVARFVRPGAGQFLPVPGLREKGAGGPWEIKQVLFFGDSGRVELIRWLEDVTPPGRYKSEPSQGRADPLAFHVTWFYRRDEDGNWYHTAPSDEYWGIPYAWHGTHLTVRATEIEAEKIDPIADELALLVAKVCDWLDCPEGDRYSLNFMDVLAPEAQGDWWALPALYLTGMPDDTHSHAAWVRAVKLWVVDALARAQVEDKDLVQREVYRQLVARLKAELRLTVSAVPDIELLARALREQRPHPFWSLWQADIHPGDPEEARLLEVEITVLLGFLEQRVGTAGLFKLLPALGQYSRLSDALHALFDLHRVELTTDWLAYLTGLSGEAMVPSLVVAVVPDQPWEPPAVPSPPSAPPGDDIAFNCDGRIWVAEADGTGVVPLTGSGESFRGLHWSPDGRWLLTAWKPKGAGPSSALYLVAADGSGGRLLTDDPALQVRALGWSPDASEAIFLAGRLDGRTGEPDFDFQALDVDTGLTRPLPGNPVWSPDNKNVVYVTSTSQWPAGTTWLARGDWWFAQQIADHASIWPGKVWSADGSRLALVLPDEVPEKTGIAVFDLASKELSPVITTADLTSAFLYTAFSRQAGGYATDGSEPAIMTATMIDRLPRTLSAAGWSADGSHLLAWIQGIRMERDGIAPAILEAIDLDAFHGVPFVGESPALPRVLAYGDADFVSASWSPTDPDRLVVAWALSQFVTGRTQAFLLDLHAGPIYTATQSLDAGWSPDGNWAAFAGIGEVIITDSDGQERFHTVIPPFGWCFELAWNPVADLSGLGAAHSHATSARSRLSHRVQRAAIGGTE